MTSEIELWAGFECTVNRVENDSHDQLERTGHSHRPQDLELLPKHGIRVVRYPVLWERTAPGGEGTEQWDWADARLEKLRALDVEPIVGLLHHGSGPNHTNLLDPEFPAKLGRYAGAVARRYPWVRRYTPINEPLTTARFSCLYGLWYPHARADRSFVRAVINQALATREAMRAIREVRPDAQLVQTEDLGAIGSSVRIAYQARFENQRRWLTWDLLCGRVNRRHPLWAYLRKHGALVPELQSLVDEPCAPDFIGVNHYVTSNRYLDHRLPLYPVWSHGGNGRDLYADVEAARVPGIRVGDLGSLLGEAWRRYGIPIAITEAHLGGAREQQLRWLNLVWSEAERARSQGVDIRSITLWSFLGAYDWDSLVTKQQGHYESGAYDVSAGQPRPTAVADLVTCLSKGEDARHPVVAGEGWWQRSDRFHHGGSPVTASASARPPLLVAGATGTLGRAFARVCEMRGIAYRLVDRKALDIADPASVRAALDEIKPWGVINAAGYVRVDEAEGDQDLCRRENVLGPELLAAECADRGLKLLTFSSDLVFDGKQRAPYRESAARAPLNVYGHSKAEAEDRVMQRFSDALVVRTSAFFGPWDAHNFLSIAMRRFESGESVVAAGDCLVSPTYVPDLVHGALDLLIDGERGIWHLANRGSVSWADLAWAAARVVGVPSSLVQVRTAAEMQLRAARPIYSVLGTERGAILGSLDDALAKFWDQRETVSCRAVS